ncbi:MAG: cell division protein ZipA [Proteobacteria bacterium]|nr:cell division protein ZipA [Pseudomonadota bacterium]NOG59362.1 cell division protein ZipA [Pseudomonadota bacterium]
MDNLRLILLIIGCLIVLGIYLWEIFNNNKPKKRTDILNAVDEVPDSPVFPLNRNETIADNFPADALADLGSLLAPSHNRNSSIDDSRESFQLSNTEETLDDEVEVDLPLEMSVKDYEASIVEKNEPDIFAAIEDESEIKENLNEDVPAFEEVEEAEVPENNKSSEDLLVLYITSPSHISFNGLSISKSADEVGMIYGHMNIFHHFGPGKLHSGQPLFSLANMHEPGSFDLGRMADLKTKGLAVFMYSPASIDATVVFELFLNTTQRLAKLLGGTVRTADNEELNNTSICALREKAELLSAN